MTDELLNERYALAIERIRQIPTEKSVPQPYRDFFAQMAQYLCKTGSPFLLKERPDAHRETSRSFK